MGFYTEDYWSGLPFPSPGDLPNPGIESASLTSPALAGGFLFSFFFPYCATWEALITDSVCEFTICEAHLCQVFHGVSKTEMQAEQYL